MRNIAAELKVSSTALYRHFKNKDAIIDVLIAQGFGELMKKLTASLNESSANDRLKITLSNYIEFGMQEANIYMLMFAPHIFIKDANYVDQKKYRLPITRFIEDRVIDVTKQFKNQTVNINRFSKSIWCFMHGFVMLNINQQIELAPEELNTYLNEELKTWIDQLK